MLSHIKKIPKMRKTMHHMIFAAKNEASINFWSYRTRENQFLFHRNVQQLHLKQLMDGWFPGFKNRFRIGSLQTTRESFPRHQKSVEPFAIKLQEKINEHSLCLEPMYNADEFSLYWRCFPQKTSVASTRKGVLFILRLLLKKN